METFTEKELISFGNYLLSDERNAITSDTSRQNVTHADIENFKEILQSQKEIVS